MFWLNQQTTYEKQFFLFTRGRNNLDPDGSDLDIVI